MEDPASYCRGWTSSSRLWDILNGSLRGRGGRSDILRFEFYKEHSISACQVTLLSELLYNIQLVSLNLRVDKPALTGYLKAVCHLQDIADKAELEQTLRKQKHFEETRGLGCQQS